MLLSLIPRHQGALGMKGVRVERDRQSVIVKVCEVASEHGRTSCPPEFILMSSCAGQQQGAARSTRLHQTAPPQPLHPLTSLRTYEWFRPPGSRKARQAATSTGTLRGEAGLPRRVTPIGGPGTLSQVNDPESSE